MRRQYLQRFTAGWVGVMGAGLAIALAASIVWGTSLFRGSSGTGSLDDRVTAVGATVRCPICREPIPLNDVQNTQAVQMRQFIRDQLTRGLSEDAVRQALVDRYGAGILLAPPESGFGLLAWLIPVAAVLLSAGSIFLALRRWSTGGGHVGLYKAGVQGNVSSEAQTNAEALQYDQILDRELAARD